MNLQCEGGAPANCLNCVHESQILEDIDKILTDLYIQEMSKIDDLVVIFCNKKDSVRDRYNQLLNCLRLNRFVEMFHSDLTDGQKKICYPKND